MQQPSCTDQAPGRVPSQKVSTCLWFDDNAEEAVDFYLSLFDDARVLGVTRYGPGMHMPDGMALTITFELVGTEFTALNGGPHFTFSEASSMVIKCDSQAEIDRIWSAILTGGGAEQQCGWIKDRFGLPWQVIPKSLGPMLQDADHAKANRALAAILGMVKLDIAAIEAAFEGQQGKGEG